MKPLCYILIILLFALMSTKADAKNVEAMPQNVIWQMTINNIDPIPQASGFQIGYRVQLQCSALSENEAHNTELRFPAQNPTYFSLPIAHPAIESFFFDAANNEWVVDFQDVIFAGTSIEFDIIAHSPNHTTPNGTTFIIDGTILSDNAAATTANSTGEWSATANLDIKKYLQFGPDTDALLDIPVKYYLYPCDPSFNSNAYGHLYLENWTLVDQLPAGTVYNTSSGTYDSGNHSVTWSDTNYLENEECDFLGATDYWVEVIFPSSVFGAAAIPPVLEATNTATFEGYPIGEATIPANLLSDSDAILHGFGLPNPIGSHTKAAYTPYVGTQDITYEGDRADFHIAIRTSSASSLPYYFKIIDPLPCLDHTPNAATQYESPGLNDPVCSNNMAYQPNEYIQLALAYNYLTISDPASFVVSNPTIPLGLVTTNGDMVSVNVPFAEDYFNQLLYRITWADIQASIGAGVGVASVIWDSETIGVQVGVTPANLAQAARLSLYGNVAEDSPAYPMLNQYRVRNYGYFFIKALGVEDSLGAIQDDVIIFDENPIVELQKTMSESTGLVILTTDSNGGSFRPTDSLIVTDLLPLGYTFGEEAQQFVIFEEGNWYWSTSQGNTNSSEYPELDVISVKNYIDVEIIDDYNGTGRQLVRATFLPPPVVGVWESMKTIRFSFYLEQTTMNFAAVNTYQVFPTDPISAQNLLYQSGFSSFPVPPSSNDINDLDGDGITTGDSYGEEDETIIPSGTIVDVRSYQAVRGDLASAEFEPFPAVAGITNQGGVADFQINIQNIGGVGLENMVVYDILPHIGDTGLSETQVGSPRGSAFDVTFTGIDMSTLPSGTVVEYSISTNPCRNELTTGATPFPTGCINDWTTIMPSPIGDVKALRLTFPTGDISQFIPGESLSIEYGVTYPVGVQPGEVAWNNFAYAAIRMDDLSSILPTEAPKVGIAIPQVDLTLTKSVSPSSNFVGDTTFYTIILDHQGDVTSDGVYTLPAGTVKNVTLVDNFLSQGLTIVSGSSTITNTLTNSDESATFNETDGTITIAEMGPLDNYEITYYAYTNSETTITNTVEVMSHPGVDDSDSTPGNGDNAEDDYAQATASWTQPNIQLQTLVESHAGSGIFIEADASDGLSGTYTAGQPINYQFVITNTGSTYLYNLSLVDNLVGFECNQTVSSLAIGVSATINCTWQYGFPDGVNPYIDIATISGEAILGSERQDVSDTDSAQVVIMPCNLILGANGTNPTCEHGANGSIEITTTNGTAPYIISWIGTSSGNQIGANLPFSMNNLLNGTYEITITDANGCRDQGTVVLDNSSTCASIGDYVWIDENQDGIQQNSESGVSGITVTLMHTNGQIVASTSTDAYGRYLFSNLNPDTYLVQFAGTTNYTFTNLGNNGPDDSAVNPLTGITNPIVLSAGESNKDVDAGFIYNLNSSLSIGDFVWLDDGNGIQDSGEPGISGLMVILHHSNGNTADVTQTNKSGHYKFEDVTAGDYYVGFTSPVGYTFTSQTNNTDNGSDASLTTGQTATFTIGSTSLTNIDAGFVSQSGNQAILGSTVWFDSNNNGIQDATEAGVQGVTIHIYTAADVLMATTETNVLGNYTFSNLIPGDYYIEFDISSQSGYSFVTADAGTDNTLDSDVDDSNGVNTTGMISLVTGERNMTVDAGIYNASSPISSLGYFVWFDNNKDGIQDTDEIGASGISVSLSDDSGTLLSTTMTDWNGFYLFPNLLDGDYIITMSNLPEGYIFSPSFNSVTATSTDSAANENGEISATISGSNNFDANAGIHQALEENATSSIGNLVFYDANSNGVQDAEDIGISEVKVHLYSSLDDDNPVSTVKTDGNGNYLFNDLAKGDYTIGFERPSADYEFTNSNAGNDDTKDSDAIDVYSATIVKSHTITLSKGEDDSSIDAGLRNTANSGSIGDLVWFDANNNGIQDGTEIGVQGVTVTLFDDSGLFTSSTSTNTNGTYTFYGLANGAYMIRFTNFPANMSLAPQANNTTDGSDANPTTGLTNTITISSGLSQVLDIDAGLQGSVAALGNYVWLDENADGLQNVNETGIHGATVTTYQNGTYISAITDENGFYSFPNLAPDTYSTSISTLPNSLSYTTKGNAINSDMDSDVDPISGFTTVTTLTAGEVNPTIDAGLIIPIRGSLGNYAWFDNITTNGLQETGESGVAGITISLSNDEGELKAVAITDVNGYYLFNGLSTDDYAIEVSTIPKDFVLTYQDASTTEDGMDSDADRDLNTSANFNVDGSHLRNIDVGIAKLNIQGYAWYDADNNGRKEGSETLLEGVKVKLFLTDSTVVDSTITNASGFYEFLEMNDDDYFISFDESNNTGGFSFASGTEHEANGDSDITDADDSDMDPYSRRTPDFNLILGETKRNIDAGFVIVPLPVELIHFSGLNMDCDNILSWSTATEENNSHFIVELSVDGIDFEALGHVQGNGNSTERIDYLYTHEDIRKKYNYYRLMQVDFGGTSHY